MAAKARRVIIHAGLGHGQEEVGLMRKKKRQSMYNVGVAQGYDPAVHPVQPEFDPQLVQLFSCFRVKEVVQECCKVYGPLPDGIFRFGG